MASRGVGNESIAKHIKDLLTSMLPAKDVIILIVIDTLVLVFKEARIGNSVASINVLPMLILRTRGAVIQVVD
jgi:hypothetical protein